MGACSGSPRACCPFKNEVFTSHPALQGLLIRIRLALGPSPLTHCFLSFLSTFPMPNLFLPTSLVMSIPSAWNSPPLTSHAWQPHVIEMSPPKTVFPDHFLLAFIHSPQFINPLLRHPNFPGLELASFSKTHLLVDLHEAESFEGLTSHKDSFSRVVLFILQCIFFLPVFPFVSHLY